MPRRASLLDTDVKITVTGPIMRATLTQKFRNSSGQRVAGIYAFPLPEGATIDALTMRIGARLVKGKITPRYKAGQLNQAARDAGGRASSPSRHRPNIFTSTLATIGPREEITIRIDYQQMLRRSEDAYSLRFPLALAPRQPHKPQFQAVKFDGRAGVSGRADGNINPVSLQVKLDSGFPLDRVTSDSHEIAVRRVDETSALIAFTQGRVPAGRDFQLNWKAKGSAFPETAAFYENLDDQTYMLTLLAPPKSEAAPAPVAREVIFVIDSSGSMAGTSIAQAKYGVTLALKRLRTSDRFNIIAFRSDFKKLFREPLPATARSLTRARDFVSGLEAYGGKDILPALKAALDRKGKNSAKRIRQVLFFTDGAISHQAELFSTLATERGSSRLFMVGTGSPANSFAMRRAAEIGRGRYVHIGSGTQALNRMNRLFERLERPVITDLRLEWPPGLRVDAWPDPLPDLYAGEPLLVSARVSALRGNLKISGNIAGRPWKHTLALAGAKKGSGVSKFWARRKIASLEARLFSGQRASDVAMAIETVALEHSLVSRMTGIVALDVTAPQPGDQPLASEDLPVDLADPKVYGKVSGTGTAELFTTRRMAREDIAAPSEENSKLALNTGKSGAGGLTAPGTPEASDRTWILTVMALIFAAMTALTSGLWRHLRHAVEPPRTGRSML